MRLKRINPTILMSFFRNSLVMAIKDNYFFMQQATRPCERACLEIFGSSSSLVEMSLVLSLVENYITIFVNLGFF